MERVISLEKLNLSSLSLAVCCYLLIATVIKYLFPLSIRIGALSFELATLPDRAKSLIAQPGLIFIPYLVGKPILFVTKRFLSVKENLDFTIELLITWSLGIIFIAVLETILYVNNVFKVKLS